VDDLRALLQDLADDVRDVVPPVDLVQRGRRRGRRLVLASTTAVVLAVTGVAVLIPDSRSSHGHPQVTSPVPPEATAAELRTGTWKTDSGSPAGNGDGAQMTWTGKEVLVIGGGPPEAFSTRNAAYDPATRAWRELAPAPSAIGRADGVEVWLGDRLLVLPGHGPAAYTAQYDLRPLLYDPVKDTWTPTAGGPGFTPTSATRVGAKVLVAGIAGGQVRAALYDPAADTWTEKDPVTPHPSDTVIVLHVAAGTLLWSGWMERHTDPNGLGSLTAGVDVLRLTDHWEDLTDRRRDLTPAQDPQVEGEQVLIGSETPICRLCKGVLALGPAGLLLDGQTLETHREAAGPLDVGRPYRTWTGGAEIDLNLAQIGGSDPVEPNQAAVLDLASQTWFRLPDAPLDLASSTRPVWASDRLVTLSRSGRAMVFGAQP
jgi:hypothetical protein